MRIVHVLAVAVVLAGASCTVLDPSHCGNQDKNATCRMLHEGAPVCDLCVATRNGCIESSLVPSCPAEDLGESTSEATGSGGVGDASFGEQTAASETTAADPTAASASGTGDTYTTAQTESDEGRFDEGSTSMQGETSSTTLIGETEEAVCGDGMVAPPEQCDGEDLDGATCATVLDDPHMRGELSCTGTCELTTVNCCRGPGAPCLPVLNQCCGQCILLPVGGGLGLCN